MEGWDERGGNWQGRASTLMFSRKLGIGSVITILRDVGEDIVCWFWLGHEYLYIWYRIVVEFDELAVFTYFFTGYGILECTPTCPRRVLKVHFLLNESSIFY